MKKIIFFAIPTICIFVAVLVFTNSKSSNSNNEPITTETVVNNTQRTIGSIEGEVTVEIWTTADEWKSVPLVWGEGVGNRTTLLPPSAKYKITIDPMSVEQINPTFIEPWDVLTVSIASADGTQGSWKSGRLGKMIITNYKTDTQVRMTVGTYLTPERLDLTGDGQIDSMDIVAFLDSTQRCQLQLESNWDEFWGCSYTSIDGTTTLLDFDVNGVTNIDDFMYLLAKVDNVTPQSFNVFTH